MGESVAAECGGPSAVAVDAHSGAGPGSRARGHGVPRWLMVDARSAARDSVGVELAPHAGPDPRLDGHRRSSSAAAVRVDAAAFAGAHLRVDGHRFLQVEGSPSRAPDGHGWSGSPAGSPGAGVHFVSRSDRSWRRDRRGSSCGSTYGPSFRQGMVQCPRSASRGAVRIDLAAFARAHRGVGDHRRRLLSAAAVRVDAVAFARTERGVDGHRRPVSRRAGRCRCRLPRGCGCGWSSSPPLQPPCGSSPLPSPARTEVWVVISSLRVGRRSTPSMPHACIVARRGWIRDGRTGPGRCLRPRVPRCGWSSSSPVSHVGRSRCRRPRGPRSGRSSSPYSFQPWPEWPPLGQSPAPSPARQWVEMRIGVLLGHGGWQASIRPAEDGRISPGSTGSTRRLVGG